MCKKGNEVGCMKYISTKIKTSQMNSFGNVQNNILIIIFYLIFPNCFTQSTRAGQRAYRDHCGVRLGAI
jgi:hypothetical protein